MEEDEKDGDWKPTTKKKKVEECLVHCSSNPGKLIKVKEEQWDEIVGAAKLLKWNPVLELSAVDKDKGIIPSVHYHKNCLSAFKLRAKRVIPDEEKHKNEVMDEMPTEKSSKRVLSSEICLPSTCMFCKSAYKYVNHMEKEKAHVITSKEAKETIIPAQKIQKDGYIQHILNNYDIVAAKGHTHHTCYKKFVRVLYQAENPTSKTESEFVKHLRGVIERKEIHGMESLYKVFIDLSSSTDYSGKSSQSYKNMKRRVKRIIDNEFASDFHVHEMENGRLLVIPKNLSAVELAERNFALDQNDKCLLKASQILRKELLQNAPTFSWPPRPSELSAENDNILEFTKLFLESLLNIPKSSQMNLKMQSVWNDLSYAVTKSPSGKHVLLAFAIKSLSGNVELIKILNRFGHSISQSKLLEIDTAQAILKILETESQGVVLPNEVQVSHPTTLVYDNIDRLEETLNGSGTSHRMNGIAIQRGFIGPLPQKNQMSVPKTKRRSIEFEKTLILPYNSGKRSDPPFLKRFVRRYKGFHTDIDALRKNLLWVISRHVHKLNQKVPSWTGFNILLRKDFMVIKDNIGYLPTINSPATSMPTIHEMLCQALKIKEQLSLDHVILVCDQAIYAKATEVAWADQVKFRSIILRLGTFHTICTYLAVIGKRFGDAGLTDVMIESGVVAEGSVTGVLTGKHYNRSVRFHKLLYESMMRMVWDKFVVWIEEQLIEEKKYLQDIFADLGELDSENSTGIFQTLLEGNEFERIFELFHVYFDQLARENESMSEFWISYVTMVSTLLNIIRASREGNFQLHLESIESIIPWCFAYDRTNYARYLPWYIHSMRELQESNLSAWEYLQNGGFSTQMSNTNTFGRVPMDQVIEETANKDTQTPGGTKGFSLKKNAVSKYYITADFRKSCLQQLRHMVNASGISSDHPDLKRSRIHRDERDVNTLMNLFQTLWSSPFEKSELSNISTGVIATQDVKDDLLHAYEKGLNAYNNFTIERLCQPRVKSFMDKIPKQKLKTFGSMNKKAVKVGGKEIELKIDRDLFERMAIIAQSRTLDMKEVMKYELGPYPWSFATLDGLLRKTNKAPLSNNLEKLSSNPTGNLDRSAIVIDAMSLVQKTLGNNKTFSEVSKSLFTRVINEGTDYLRIDVVFDVYRDISIKNIERSKREKTDAPTFANILPGHNIKQWGRFLKGSQNKRELIKFFASEWSKEEYTNKLGNKVLFIGFEDKCIKLTKSSVFDVAPLHCVQEEADTRMLFHAQHAKSEGYGNIILMSDDTDVMVIALPFAKNLNLYQRRGSQSRTRLVNLATIAEKLSDLECNAIVGLHAFTGCDTVSSFAGKGKLSALRLMKKYQNYVIAFAQLGRNLEVPDDIIEVLEIFVCEWYGGRNTKSVSDLRYAMYCAKGAKVASHQLPPGKASLRKHILRANYQAHIWRSCMGKMDHIPLPDGFGWTITAQDLLIDWSDENAAPDEVLEFLSCSCKKECCAENDCMCAKNGLGCTDICKCKNCVNADKNPEIEEEEMDEEEEEGHNCVADGVEVEENACAHCMGKYGPGSGDWSQCNKCYCWFHDACY